MLFYKENAPAHNSVTAMAAINDCGFDLIQHPSYLPDLADILKVENAISGTYFQLTDNAIYAVEDSEQLRQRISLKVELRLFTITGKSV